MARIEFPVTSEGDYKLSLRFVRIAGQQQINLHLPVGKAQSTLVLDWRDRNIHGLNQIQGTGPAQNSTGTEQPELQNGQTYNLTVEVKRTGGNASVSAQLNGRSLFKWKGRESFLTIWDGMKLRRDGIFGLAAESNAAGEIILSRFFQFVCVAVTSPLPTTIGLDEPGPAWNQGIAASTPPQ